MRFIALRSNIKDAIAATERATGENLNLPILKNALIVASGDGIIFTTTNLDLTITHHLPGKVIEDGRVTIPLALFSSLVTNLQSDRLNFEKKNNTLNIKTDNYQATIQGLPAEDFPETPRLKNTQNHLEIKGMFLKEAIQQTMVAAQFSDLRPELNSTSLNFSIDSLKFAATDGFRLAEKTLAQSHFSTSHNEPFKLLIPLKTGQEVVRMVRDDEAVKIFHDENQILFKTERAELVSRLMEGGFPDYLPLIPQKFVTEAVLNREEFLNAIKLAGIFGQKTNEIKAAAHPNKKTVEVSSADQALGENSYLLPAKVKGNTTEAFFNWRYLADPLRAMKGEEAFIGFQDENNPALLRSAGDASYFYILKPILKS